MNTLIVQTNTLSAQYAKDAEFNAQIFPASHLHNHYELFIALSDGVEYVVGDSVYTLRAYDLLFIPPTVFHHPRSVQTPPYERFFLNFYVVDVSKRLRGFLNEANTHYAFAGNGLIKSTCKELLALHERASAEDMEVATKQFLNLLLLQMKYASPAENVAQEIHPTLSKILQYIDEHLTEDLSAEALANVFFVSSSWIYQVFHNDLGIRLSGYVNNKRVLLAQRLMQSGSPPTQVYLACGFQEYSTFYRQYTKRFGCSPKSDKM